jgi:hypothetical protein
VAAEWGVLDMLQEICDWSKEKVTTEEVQKLPVDTDNKERTTWHVAAKRGNLSLIEIIGVV